MADDYHQIVNSHEVSDSSGLKIPRARAIAAAIEQRRDFSIVGLRKRSDPNAEFIVVDVESDEIPPNNTYGIKFRERLALRIPEDQKALVDVRALRKAFPVLPHQNRINAGDAPSLCLYFEPPLSVLRTWTPQSFLRRIQWWLVKTARGELHPADQPVEQLFFVSKYELILPFDFATTSKSAQTRFVVTDANKRSDGGTTFILSAIRAGNAPKSSATFIELTLSPIVHGVVEPDPSTLGELDDLLRRRGTNLFTPLKNALRERVGNAGAVITSDDPFTIFLLHVPICRAEGSPPDRIINRAFLADAGALKLGLDTGALFTHEGKYFNGIGILDQPTVTAWRSQSVQPMDVLIENDTAAARRQSGIQDAGPAGVLVGAGSLGGAMLNLWSRSGWGKWTIIDKDHIKPHNLSRHTAYFQHLGYPKAAAVAELHGAAMRDSDFTSVFGDALDASNEAVAAALSGAALVVDASTTLEYPRQASSNGVLARHVSVFVTPTGNSGVLLAEDAKRSLKLRTLEAQYYRAIIQNDWGGEHLAGDLSTFWSGASCRDISMVMPYSRITAHASTLAEQVQFAAIEEDALIRIWDRRPDTGDVVSHAVLAHPERLMKFGKLDLFIDDGVERQLRELREANLPNETGGVLLGYYDFNIDAVVIVCGLPAPPDSKSRPGFFERGTSDLVDAVNEATRRTAGVVGYVGEWHSHPRGHSAKPSGDDIIQLVHLSFGMANDGLPALQLIVGEKDIQIIQGIAAP